MGRPRGVWFVVILAVGATTALAGCSNSPSASAPTSTQASSTSTSTSAGTVAPTTSSTASAGPAPCDQAAISAAAMSAPSVGPVLSVSGFACSGTWAYANVEVGTSSANSYDAVIVLEASGSKWSVADRATACSNHLVPSSIYTQACTTS